MSSKNNLKQPSSLDCSSRRTTGAPYNLRTLRDCKGSPSCSYLTCLGFKSYKLLSQRRVKPEQVTRSSAPRVVALNSCRSSAGKKILHKTCRMGSTGFMHNFFHLAISLKTE